MLTEWYGERIDIKMKNYTDYLIELLICAISGAEPPKPCFDIDLDKLFKLAKFHAVENIVYVSLKKLDMPKCEAMERFKKQYMYSIFAHEQQQAQTKRVIDCFEKNKIKHCVMKGAVIKNLYPSPEMRISSDVDIFVFGADGEQEKVLMQSLGFEIKAYDESLAHNEYVIDNVIFEIHKQLISNKCPWDKKCQEIEKRLIPTKDYNYRYEMSTEDYYLYMIAHMAKHMKYSGIGVKMFLDVWLYNKYYESVMDKELLDSRLKYCGLDVFNDNVKKLCNYWFEKDATYDMSIMAQYVFSSGKFGTHKQLVSSEVAKNAIGTDNGFVGKIISIIKMFFLPYKKMSHIYPVLKKYPPLLPIMWIYRCFNLIFNAKTKSEKIKKKYGVADIEYGKKINEFKKSIGL